MDNGASSHMFGKCDAFNFMRPITPTQIGVSLKGGEIWVGMRGSVTTGNILFKDVLYSDCLMGNLISIGK